MPPHNVCIQDAVKILLLWLSLSFIVILHIDVEK